jgi:hypothetical protein
MEYRHCYFVWPWVSVLSGYYLRSQEGLELAWAGRRTLNCNYLETEYWHGRKTLNCDYHQRQTTWADMMNPELWISPETAHIGRDDEPWTVITSRDKQLTWAGATNPKLWLSWETDHMGRYDKPWIVIILRDRSHVKIRRTLNCDYLETDHMWR